MIIVQIAGRLGKDAESRFTPSGQKVTTLTMAANIRKAGKDETVWWRVTIWGERYDKMMPYFKKGSALVVIGEMNKPEIWTDKEGRPQTSLEITADIVRFNPFGGSTSERSPQDAAGAANNGGQSAYGASQASYAPQSNYGGEIADFAASSPQSGFSRHSQADQNEDPLPF